MARLGNKQLAAILSIKAARSKKPYGNTEAPLQAASIIKKLFRLHRVLTIELAIGRTVRIGEQNDKEHDDS
jgi:hypothetical protein